MYNINKNEIKKVEWRPSEVGLWRCLDFGETEKCCREVTQILEFR